MATWKQIETSREVRLWLVQVIAPVGAILAGAYLTNPKFEAAVNEKVKKVKDKFKKN